MTTQKMLIEVQRGLLRNREREAVRIMLKWGIALVLLFALFAASLLACGQGLP